jgi:hypothetical protein
LALVPVALGSLGLTVIWWDQIEDLTGWSDAGLIAVTLGGPFLVVYVGCWLVWRHSFSARPRARLARWGYLLFALVALALAGHVIRVLDAQETDFLEMLGALGAVFTTPLLLGGGLWLLASMTPRVETRGAVPCPGCGADLSAGRSCTCPACERTWTLSELAAATAVREALGLAEADELAGTASVDDAGVTGEVADARVG